MLTTRFSSLACGLLAGLLCVSGCATPKASPPATEPALAATDPCATRLHDIAGAMLMYYIVNKKLPPDLPALQPFAETGATLDFTCPVSHRPYAYALRDPAQPVTERRLVLHDVTPAHHGRHWAIVAEPAQSLTQPVTLWVLQLDNKALYDLLGPEPGQRGANPQ